MAGDHSSAHDVINRYNPFCLKRPLMCSDQERQLRADKHTARGDLSETVRAALYFHELTDAVGLEFVAFANVRLPGPVRLFGNILLVPCFTVTREEEVADAELSRLTQRMLTTARFIYDGWLPISDWEPAAVAATLRTIDE